MYENIVIIGAGGHAKEIAFLIEDINSYEMTWNILGYIDRDTSNLGKNNGRYKIIGDERFFDDYKGELNAVVAIGDPTKLKEISSRIAFKYQNVKFPNLIHPSALGYIRDVKMKRGNIICAGNIFTTDINIGSYNCFNRGCNISHDVEIGDCCVINPGVNISGGIKIGSGCLIGTGATILQYLNIGENSTIGAGAVVVKDVKPSDTVVGIPASSILKH